MVRSRFHWALRILDMFGLIVCCKNQGYFVKQKSDYVDLNSDPEIQELLRLEKLGSNEIIKLALKLNIRAFTH